MPVDIGNKGMHIAALVLESLNDRFEHLLGVIEGVKILFHFEVIAADNAFERTVINRIGVRRLRKVVVAHHGNFGKFYRIDLFERALCLLHGRSIHGKADCADRLKADGHVTAVHKSDSDVFRLDHLSGRHIRSKNADQCSAETATDHQDRKDPYNDLDPKLVFHHRALLSVFTIIILFLFALFIKHNGEYDRRRNPDTYAEKQPRKTRGYKNDRRPICTADNTDICHLTPRLRWFLRVL